jgi:hypothetical protein
MGFNSCLGPESAIQALDATPGIKALGAETLVQGLALAFPFSSKQDKGKQDKGKQDKGRQGDGYKEQAG